KPSSQSILLPHDALPLVELPAQDFGECLAGFIFHRDFLAVDGERYLVERHFCIPSARLNAWSKARSAMTGPILRRYSRQISSLSNSNSSRSMSSSASRTTASENFWPLSASVTASKRSGTGATAPTIRCASAQVPSAARLTRAAAEAMAKSPLRRDNSTSAAPSFGFA